MSEELQPRRLRSIYIKDIGWKTATPQGAVWEITEHPVNGWVTITVSDEKKTKQLVDPRWIIVKEYI